MAGEEVLERPEIVAANRGGDPGRLMEGEADPGTASVELAVFWTRVYAEILSLEERVIARVQELMVSASPRVRREVELTNLPVIASQVERFRQRHGYWALRLDQLRGPPA